jgi:CRP/FNR family cyclic AMP-dependent transcriptional regulator
MLAARIELLQQMPIFGGVRDETLQFLLEPTRTVGVAAGGFFFREQDPADSMYVLEAGRVAVLKQWRGRELVLRHFGPGDCFGEMALLDLFPRSAAVRAEQDCTAIELTPTDLLRLFERDVEQFAIIQMNIGREMCRRLRTTDEMLFQAAMGEPPATVNTFFQSM